MPPSTPNPKRKAKTKLLHPPSKCDENFHSLSRITRINFLPSPFKKES